MSSKLTGDQLRQRYLDFFKDRGHAVIPSSPLVPENDPTTLFTPFGMQPLVPYLLGESHPLGTRLVDSQKCFRSQDIEEVGDNRHDTFFEMLGNWSLGDYFKEEQLRWVFTFLTKEVDLNPKKLFVTVFEGKQEIGIPKDKATVEIWQKLFKEKNIEAKDIENAEKKGMQGGRIFYYEAKKNWWSRVGVPENMPVGEPGGPDSEVFYDFGPSTSSGQMRHDVEKFGKHCHVNCDCGRFLEIGNSVFMEYVRTENGFESLPNKNVDFGGGLERMLAAANDDPDVFQTDLFSPIISQIEKLSGKKYSDVSNQTSMRVIADHVKAAVMLAADGVFPSNKEQGYFSRRLVRRAIRHGKMLGIEDAFIAELIQPVVEIYQEQYEEVEKQKDKIQNVLGEEEKKFRKTLEKGLREIEKIDKLDGKVAFQLFETYGFPFELTQEIAEERGQLIDEREFQQEKQQHAQQSRTASSGMFKGGLADQSEETVKFHTATHLLHAALRKFLGDSVQQKGSNITAERLRFDFSFDRALTDEEKQKVEDQVNAWIAEDLPVTRQEMKKSDALKSGAIAFFIEKYPDEVSVYTIGQDVNDDWISKEFCGGPHVKHTGEIGTVKIQKEQAVSAGVRRIYMGFI